MYVLGGGLVRGSLVLLGGEPGIGKSTLILQLCNKMSGEGKVLYVSGEESYTVSRLLTMSFYYDRQTNTPLHSSSSYPTTTQDFGLSMKFSLTR